MGLFIQLPPELLSGLDHGPAQKKPVGEADWLFVLHGFSCIEKHYSVVATAIGVVLLDRSVCGAVVALARLGMSHALQPFPRITRVVVAGINHGSQESHGNGGESQGFHDG